MSSLPPYRVPRRCRRGSGAIPESLVGTKVISIHQPYSLWSGQLETMGIPHVWLSHVLLRSRGPLPVGRNVCGGLLALTNSSGFGNSTPGLSQVPYVRLIEVESIRDCLSTVSNNPVPGIPCQIQHFANWTAACGEGPNRGL